MAALLVTAPFPAVAASVKIDPNTMLVEGVRGNLHTTTTTPTFSWTFPGPGTQTNWQIQVDSDPNFFPTLWFWDSGTLAKGSLGASQSAKYGEVYVATGNNSGALLPVDSRPELIYWRLRVQADNDPNWDKDPNNFSYGVFKMNQVPLQPLGLTASLELNAGTVPGFAFPAPNPAPKAFYVAPNGDDNNPGTFSQPYRSITRGAQALNPGDTLFLRGGTYVENVVLSPSRGFKVGTPGNPLTVKNYPNERPVVRGVAAGSQQPYAPFSMVGSGGPLRYWVLDGVTLGGTNVAAGVYINACEFITIRNLSFEPTFSTGAIGVHLVGGGLGNRILDSTFDTPMFDNIDVGSSRGVEIRGNRFSNINRHTSIIVHGGGSQTTIIADNVFHDGAPAAGVVSFYLSSDGGVARNNVVYNITEPPNGQGTAFQVIRSGKVLIENNTVVNCRTGVILAEYSRLTTLRNNIFYGTHTAVNFDIARSAPVYQFSASAGTVIGHNFFFNNDSDITLAYPEDANALTLSANCFGGPRPSPNTACDPNFQDLANNDFRPAAGSPVIDAGDPNVPVPLGAAGGVRDVGAIEYNLGLPPYEYQTSATIADITPRFTWALRDPDNILNSLFPASFTDTDSQSGFEVQVDTVSTFDSVGGTRPLFSSGQVLSSTQGYTVPDASALAPGDYYVRVRQRDEHQAAFGAWSDGNYRVRVAMEPQPPVLRQQSPAPGAQGVSVGTTISAHVVDYGLGVDSSTIEMRIGVDDPSVPTVVTPQITQSGPTPADFLVTYVPAQPFPSASTIYVRILASDLASPPNTMTPPAYSFSVQDLVAPGPPPNVRVVP